MNLAMPEEMTEMFTVRPFRPEDFRDILSMAMWLSENSSFKNAGFSVDKVTRLFAEIGASDDKYFCRIAGTDECPVAGIFIGTLDDYYFSDAIMGRDMAIMFRPDMRTGHIAALRKMFSEFEGWCRSKGAIEVNMGAATGLDGKGLLTTLEACGYSTRGYYMRKRID